ncbi:MAG: hypothetical protein ACR2J8_06960, partial [Thermomicrobiales bacterium]
INSFYDRLASEAPRRKTGAEQGPGYAPNRAVSLEDKEHIRTYSTRARLFISNIQQRRETLLRISA